MFSKSLWFSVLNGGHYRRKGTWNGYAKEEYLPTSPIGTSHPRSSLFLVESTAVSLFQLVFSPGKREKRNMTDGGPPPQKFSQISGPKKAYRPHQRRRAKITATVRLTLERSILSSILILFDGSVKKRHKKGFVFIPVFGHKNTRPNTLNKRLYGWYFLQKKLGKLGQNDPFWAPKTGIVTGNPSGG